jgi:hypothetical protein
MKKKELWIKLDDNREISELANIRQVNSVRNSKYKPGEIYKPPVTPSDGRRWIKVGGKVKHLSTVVWASFRGTIKTGYVIDHISGDRTDDRLSNLRCITQSQNLKAYRTPSPNKTSKYRGVNKSGKKWRAKIPFNKKTKHLGYFENEEDAARAWNRAAIAYGYLPEALNKIKRKVL